MIESNKIIKKLVSLAEKAYKIGEIPVSAVVIHNNLMISWAFNLREKKNDITAHAEVLAIKKAAKRLKRWNLADCDLYVSLRPCRMCEEIIRQCRIKNVYFLLDKLSYKHDYAKTSFKKLDSDADYESYQQLLTNFFQNMR